IEVVQQARDSPAGCDQDQIEMSATAIESIARFANGDARTALNILEMAILNGQKEDQKITVTTDILEQLISKKTLLYDKNGEEHYNIISALHKSMRNSDVNAAIYWLTRMLTAGEDALYIARRVVCFASEDIGLADTGGLFLDSNVFRGCQIFVMPKCNVYLHEEVIYVGFAPIY